MSLSQKGAKIMTRDELIAKCYFHTGAAAGASELNHHDQYAEHMSTLLDLLIEELVGSPPAAEPKADKRFNPERVLEEIAIAIKHRTYSSSERWNIVYYHERLTCVPSYINVPPEIILNEFTEQMVQRGLSVIYWNGLKQNVVKLYKELQK